MKTIDELLESKKGTTEEVLAIFDALSPAEIDFMIGRWKGFEIKTDHQMDGMLEPSGWYGKMFISKEEVHPLLMFANDKTELYSVNPKHIPLEMKLPKSDFLGTMMKLTKPVLQTHDSKARLRMIEYRGKVTATMAYDEKAIFDHFAKIDENTVLGVMDLKNVAQPYIFVLQRDDQTAYKMDI